MEIGKSKLGGQQVNNVYVANIFFKEVWPGVGERQMQFNISARLKFAMRPYVFAFIFF